MSCKSFKICVVLDILDVSIIYPLYHQLLLLSIIIFTIFNYGFDEKCNNITYLTTGHVSRCVDMSQRNDISRYLVVRV